MIKSGVRTENSESGFFLCFELMAPQDNKPKRVYQVWKGSNVSLSSLFPLSVGVFFFGLVLIVLRLLYPELGFAFIQTYHFFTCDLIHFKFKFSRFFFFNFYLFLKKVVIVYIFATFRFSGKISEKYSEKMQLFRLPY